MAYQFNEETIKKMDEYSRLAGAIKQKYPDVYGENVPSSITFEYRNITYMLHVLQRVSHPTWKETTASNGMKVDAFELKNYEEALKDAKMLREHNESLVSTSDVEKYKFPEIDKKEVEEKMSSVSSFAEAQQLKNELRDSDCQSFANRQILNDYASQVSEKGREFAKQEMEKEGLLPSGASENTNENSEVEQSAETPSSGFFDKVKDLGSKIVDAGKNAMESIREKVFGPKPEELTDPNAKSSDEELEQ